MLKALGSILETISSLITFLIHTITSLTEFITKIPIYVTFLNNSILLLPAILIPFLIASISIYVVLFIIGRSK